VLEAKNKAKQVLTSDLDECKICLYVFQIDPHKFFIIKVVVLTLRFIATAYKNESWKRLKLLWMWLNHFPNSTMLYGYFCNLIIAVFKKRTYMRLACFDITLYQLSCNNHKTLYSSSLLVPGNTSIQNNVSFHRMWQNDD